MNSRVLKVQLVLHSAAALVGLGVWRWSDVVLWKALALAELGVVIVPGYLVLAVLAVLRWRRGPE